MRRRNGGRILDLQTDPKGHVLTGKYRRNGKLQSCEPCRKSKLRCDHVVPTCQRCIRRNCASKCIYHPGPLTKSRQTRPNDAVPLTPSTSTTTAGDQAAASSATALDSSMDPLFSASPLPSTAQAHGTSNSELAQAQQQQQYHRAASAPPRPTAVAEEEEAVRMDPGFLGASSFTRIFEEGQPLLGLGVHGDGDDGRGTGTAAEVDAYADLRAAQLSRVTVSAERVARGCRALGFLRDRQLAHRVVICPEAVMREWLWQLGLHHGDALKEDPDQRDPARLRRLCERLWHNTQTPVPVSEATTPLQWMRLATGAHIRWEVIGIIAAVMGQCAATLRPSDPFLRQLNIARPAFPRRMHELASTCLDFCRECDALGDLFIWLLLETSALSFSLRGDGSYIVYRESGEQVNAVVAMGLHKDIGAGKRIPMWLAELRRRALAQVYSDDLSISVFLGRPPRFPRRYCRDLTPPLDIPEAQLLAEEHRDPADLLRLVDANGDNRAGKVGRMTFVRLLIGFAPIREDTLELYLGEYGREEILQRTEACRRRSEAYWEGLPGFVKKFVTEGDFEAAGPGPGQPKLAPWEAVLKVLIRQGLRANELLLQRVLVQRTGAGAEALVRTARLIIDDVLRIARRHDVAAQYQSIFGDLLAKQGLRSAAVLAVELLKQEQEQQQQQQNPRNNHQAKPPLLPRSRTIQDLAVLAALLGDVEPSDGAFGVCQQGRKYITRILDKILTPTPAATVSSAAATGDRTSKAGAQSTTTAMAATTATTINHAWQQQQQQLMPENAADSLQLGNFDFGFDMPLLGHDNDFMQWLENADWETPV
ncbi:hypothetical protein F4780DRAFT_772083 [Xylariomycetidae sp. FL0641]|nr:hypothetical protein F4780DRAFT_772083 [Xylariomycetidae sp. FL0641]